MAEEWAASFHSIDPSAEHQSVEEEGKTDRPSCKAAEDSNTAAGRSSQDNNP